MERPRIRIAICGGGISGLCLAVALSRLSQFNVALYEATGQFREIGAGVMIWSRTWRILELLGLAHEMSKVADVPPDGSMAVAFDYRRSDQPTEGFRFHLTQMPDGCIRFHRAEFLDVFVNALPPSIANFGKRLSSYDELPDGGYSLIFKDGATAECDILIGADGINSVVRSQMFRTGNPEDEKHIELVSTDTVAYRALIPVEKLVAACGGSRHRSIDTPMMYCGLGQHIVSYSICQGDILNVVGVAPGALDPSHEQGGPCSQAELLEPYIGWEPEVDQMLKLIERPTKWFLYQLNPLPYYVRGGVALIGDAAHAMSPHQGAGAGQAIEDAFILASTLERASDVATALAAMKAYDMVRRPIANSVLLGSRESQRMYEFQSKFGDDYETLGPAIDRQWAWIDVTAPEQDAENAREYLAQL